MMIRRAAFVELPGAVALVGIIDNRQQKGWREHPQQPNAHQDRCTSRKNELQQFLAVVETAHLESSGRFMHGK